MTAGPAAPPPGEATPEPTPPRASEASEAPEAPEASEAAPLDADERMREIIAVLSELDERRGERRKALAGIIALAPVTAVLLAAGVVFGGYMWWFFGLWTPVYGMGLRRLLRFIRDDRRDRGRLRELDFDVGDARRLPG